MTKFLKAAIISLSLVTLSATAYAADDEAAADESAVTDETAATDEAPAADAAPADEQKPAAETEKFFPRFRFGVSGMGGPILGDIRGGAGGLDLRAGVQINELIGAYIQPMVALGAGASSSDTSASLSGLAVAGLAAMAEFDFINMLFVAVGPEILAGGIAEASVSETSGSGSASKGPYFGIAARAGVAIGKTRPHRRSKFSIALDMHVIFAPNAVAVLPMIAFGFDMF
ncbi:MAG: hypothetical protein JXR91_00980 [Deltaproteobacteria bacterium]|nr:hypothetical protein [Deltaproteobacteria bacterium]